MNNSGKNFTILGIESSCDESGLALYSTQEGLIGHTLHSQLATHAEYGGVVPELASRDHIRKIIPLTQTLLNQSGHTLQDIDAIAYTAGPGLMGALFVGATMGCSLAMALNKPTIPVHHLEGHLLAPLLESPRPDYPFIALLVSGGHTQLIAVKGFRDYELLGESLDDAAGEAFDKAAKMLGLPYPGGPALAQLADQTEETPYTFPRPMTNRPGLDFSFSGLKTYTRNAIESAIKDAMESTTENSPPPGTAPTLSLLQQGHIAKAFQTAVIETLLIKCKRAVKQTGIKQLVLSGGVAANRSLRTALAELEGINCFYPRLEFCTDNGAMIAFAAHQAYQHFGDTALQHDYSVKVQPRWPIQSLGRTQAP